MSKLTQSQQAALAVDKNISVTAGAGSGKTKILVDRFLHIALEHPEKTRRILAITFTNKAAAEMLERISREVNDRLDNEEYRAERGKLLRIRDQISSAAVSTIHGFCARTLREFPFEAQLPPDFIEADDMQSTVLRQQAIERTLAWLDEEDADKDFYLPLFSLLKEKTVHNLLDRALALPYEMESVAILLSGKSEEEYVAGLEKVWLERVQAILPEQALADVRHTCQAILQGDTVSDKNEKGQRVKECLTNVAALPADALKSIPAYAATRELIDTFTTDNQTAYKDIGRLGAKKGWSPQVHSLMKELSKHCAQYAAELLGPETGAPPGQNDRLWFRMFNILLSLYEICRAHYDDLKSEAGLVDFEDLQLKILALLDGRPVIREKLAGRYDYIMVDEFQDTNALQWEIISRLTRNEDGLKEDKLFVVGDPKQSIYGFRQADVRVFMRVKETFARLMNVREADDYDGNIIFRESFRFLPGLNRFINLIFEQVLIRGAGNPFAVDYEPLEAARKAKRGGSVEIAILPKDAEEPLYMARTIRKMINEKYPCSVFEEGEERERSIRYGDIAVLLRNRTHLLEIEQTFRDENIPFKTVKGAGFWQRQEIFDFYHLLRFLDNPYDDLAAVALLRSPILLLSDEDLFLLARRAPVHWIDKLTMESEGEALAAEQAARFQTVSDTLRRWLDWRAGLPLEELLYAIIDDARLWLILSGKLNGEQLTANLVKLIEHISGFEASGIGGLGAFIENLEHLIQQEMKEGEAPVELEDESTVKIMTIHASKGLQFPVVFLPYLNADKGGNSQSTWIDPEVGMAAKLNNPDDGDHWMLQQLKNRQRLKEEAERRRVFYVGATRASNALYLSGINKKDVDKLLERATPLGWLATILNNRNIDITREGPCPELEFDLRLVQTIPEPAGESAAHQNRIDFIRELIGSANSLPAQKPETSAFITVRDTPGAQIFSATRLMTYLKDKQDYYRRYHLGFFENDYETFASNLPEDDMIMLKGKIVHRFFELLPGVKDVDSLIERVLFEYEVFDPAVRAALADDIRVYHQKTRQSPVARKMLSALEYRNEVSLTLALRDHYLTGTLDRLFRNENGNWEVLDYKTNRITAGEVTATGRHYRMQIKAYALLLSRLYPDQSEYAVSLYFLQPDQIDRHCFSPEDIQNIAAEFTKLIERIVAEYPPVNSW